jgi:hypothetical protein
LNQEAKYINYSNQQTLLISINRLFRRKPIMEKKEFLIRLGEMHGLKINPNRAERQAEPGGAWDMVQILRSILFRTEVTGYRPQDDLKFNLKEVEP